MITKDKLEELRRLEKAATPARWESNGDGTEVTGPEFFDNDGNDWQSICGSFPHKGNANLIAAARNALPALLDEIERLRAVIGEAYGILLAGSHWHQAQVDAMEKLREGIAGEPNHSETPDGSPGTVK